MVLLNCQESNGTNSVVMMMGNQQHHDIATQSNEAVILLSPDTLISAWEKVMQVDEPPDAWWCQPVHGGEGQQSGGQYGVCRSLTPSSD